VAEVDGEAITQAELEAEASGDLARVRQEEYEVRSRVLDDLVARKLIAAEARKRGLSPEELLRQETKRRTEKPTAEDIRSLYEGARDRFRGLSRDKALGHIEDALLERAEQRARAAYEEELREKASVTVHLEPPRITVEVPSSAPTKGPSNAPVTIVEFADYQCPYCHRAQSTMDEIFKEYQGRVRLVHLDYPLPNHGGAIPAARAARCAGEQGRFWDYHHHLMTRGGALDDADLADRAASLRLDRDMFAKCLASDRYTSAIRADVDLGGSIGVTGTPAYFINGRMVSGARPYSAFAEILDAELAGL
jgi:protein-disulfide isomerase